MRIETRIDRKVKGSGEEARTVVDQTLKIIREAINDNADQIKNLEERVKELEAEVNDHRTKIAMLTASLGEPEPALTYTTTGDPNPSPEEGFWWCEECECVIPETREHQIVGLPHDLAWRHYENDNAIHDGNTVVWRTGKPPDGEEK